MNETFSHRGRVVLSQRGGKIILVLVQFDLNTLNMLGRLNTQIDRLSRHGVILPSAEPVAN